MRWRAARAAGAAAGIRTENGVPSELPADLGRGGRVVRRNGGQLSLDLRARMGPAGLGVRRGRAIRGLGACVAIKVAPGPRRARGAPPGSSLSSPTRGDARRQQPPQLPQAAWAQGAGSGAGGSAAGGRRRPFHFENNCRRVLNHIFPVATSQLAPPLPPLSCKDDGQALHLSRLARGRRSTCRPLPTDHFSPGLSFPARVPPIWCRV